MYKKRSTNNRKYKRTKKMPNLGRMASQGVELVAETVGTITDTQCVYVGHASFASQHLVRSMYYAMAKAVLIQAGHVFNDWDEQCCPLIIPAGSFIQTGYRAYPTDPVNTAVGSVASGDTWRMFADKVWVANFNLFNANSMYSKSQYEFIQFNDASTLQVTTTRFNDVTFSVYSKDSLKVQNRSKPTTTDDDALDVDSIPLSGKLYFTKGNHFKHKSVLSNENFGAERFRNIIAVAAAGDKFVQEPPQSYAFDKTRSVNVTLSPGEIKTNVLIYNKDLRLTDLVTLMTQLYGGNASALDDVTKIDEYGTAAMFGLEKVIGTGSDTLGVEVKYEVQQHLYVAFKNRMSKYTSYLIENF